MDYVSDLKSGNTRKMSENVLTEVKLTIQIANFL